MLTIGMAVYNSVNTVEKAVLSLLAQTHTNFTLIISDNASTDGTREWLEKIQTKDSRIVCLYQPTNVGAIRNFQTVLHSAKTPFFMFAAADDYWEPTFAEKNIAFLQQHPDYSASISKVERSDLHTSNSVEMGTRPLTGSIKCNLTRYIIKAGWNSRYYSVFRTDVIQTAWIDDQFWAHDFAVMANTLLHGKHHEIQEVLMSRSAEGESGRRNIYRSILNRKMGFFHTRYPMAKCTVYLFKIKQVRENPITVLRVLYLNLKYRIFMAYMFFRTKITG